LLGKIPQKVLFPYSFSRITQNSDQRHFKKKQGGALADRRVKTLRARAFGRGNQENQKCTSPAFSSEGSEPSERGN